MLNSKLELTAPQSILTPIRQEGFNAKKRKNSERTLTPRYWYVLSLHLAGAKAEEISKLTGYSKLRISYILNSEAVIGVRQQLMKDLDKEFEAQYRKVIAAIDDSLSIEQPNTVKLQAAKLWGDYHKKFQKVEGNTQINITAEDIVFQIMNGQYNPNNTPISE